MKTLILSMIILLPRLVFPQSRVNGESVRYQQQRMVFQQWDKNKFKPSPGFLHLNPYYWLVWGLFDPNYHKTDRRPLSATGPQSQRLGMVGVLQQTEHNYRLHADTVQQTALSVIASQSGLLSDADPLWLLYYSKALKTVTEDSPDAALEGLSPEVRAKVRAEGLYAWYKTEFEMLRERINGSRSADMDRGARILSWYRFLNEYRELAAVWATRIAAAQKVIDMTAQQKQVITGKTNAPRWTSKSDIEIANRVLENAKY